MRRSLPYYMLATLLVAVYVSLNPVWMRLVATMGHGTAHAAPVVILLLILLLGVILAGWAYGHTMRPNWKLLLVGVVFALVGLALTDASYPAKRIHVAEYLLLAVVVRRALSYHLSGIPLSVFTALTTMLCGVHDELIQGLHPNRTYGLTDCMVNGTGALAGALMTHALGLFDNCANAGKVTTLQANNILACGMTFSGLVLLLCALPAFRDLSIPLWTTVPLLAGSLAWLVTEVLAPTKGSVRHGMGLLLVLSVLAGIYPVLANTTSLVFR